MSRSRPMARQMAEEIGWSAFGQKMKALLTLYAMVKLLYGGTRQFPHLARRNGRRALVKPELLQVGSDGNSRSA